MNVDIEIYLSNLIKFFKQNPNDLMKLVPKQLEEKFYQKIRDVAIGNLDAGREIILTQKQIVALCVELNTEFKNESIFVNNKAFQKLPIGYICLN